MHIEYPYLFLLIILAVALCSLLTYFIVRAYSVPRSLSQQLNDKLTKQEAQLVSQKEAYTTLSEVQKKTEASLATKSNEKNQLALELARVVATYENIKTNYEQARETSAKQQIKIDELSNINQRNTSLLARLEANNAALKESIASQKNQTEENNKNAMLAFTTAADKILEEKTQKFASYNKENIKQLLDPLGEKLKDFKQKVEETYDKEAKQRFSLEDKIKELVGLNQQISKEASNLTNALKGQAKTQGDWGEMILENILEYSGLVKDREYFVQQSYVDDEGNRKQPDIKIKYPDNRIVIIDSKVSLNAYERYANSDDITEQKKHLNDHCRSIKNHVDDLSGKEYDRVDKALDFVMLFVPIEPAYITAVQQDPDLWAYAYNKRVLLISPTNLIAALKMVSDIWKREHQNNNAMEISKRGELLYDKFVNFIEDMEGINKHLIQATGSYGKAMDKLSRGTGNLISQAQKLKDLGLKPKKNLSDKHQE